MYTILYTIYYLLYTMYYILYYTVLYYAILYYTILYDTKRGVSPKQGAPIDPNDFGMFDPTGSCLRGPSPGSPAEDSACRPGLRISEAES